MPYYRAVGQYPAKRHVAFSLDDGTPCFEEFIGEEGFSSTGSLLYHRHVPSALVGSRDWDLGDQTLVPNTPLLPRHFRVPDAFDDVRRADAVRGRRLVLGNADVRISYVAAEVDSPLYSNGVGDEIVFVESGAAVLESIFGRIEVRQGDNVVIPRVTIHRWLPVDVDTLGPLRLLCVEASGHVTPPDKHRSRYGQFLEGSPMTERDFRVPQGPLLADDAIAGEDTDVYVKHRAPGTPSGLHGSVVTYDHHPFDVVGWDGQLYPYAFNYRDFAPVVGAYLQPPPTYQVFSGSGFVVCNFVPRPLEFGPDAIKVPYYHSNVDSDEVMFYFAGETAARKGSGIRTGSISLHPAAYTHGPRRQAYLDSPGLSEPNEMAFMVDTFAPLAVGEAGRATDDPSYPWSWSDKPHAGGRQ
ncbi:homogentisate 1,2-dioxygenase [Nocardioides sp. zg-ZUI104]|uniref:homogentisate 1,2-dioxygenase n=1 Tax=Nocardioides faecalis TaxID=2803858 RepID=UPI001BCDA8F1|nr:homogentisate 1,2-dioxygenase domain-containing protein [Nocardioides faecalis]MBS4752232.1 homogentisate 1,2-dioxygenase [Nocardioides faecalis]